MVNVLATVAPTGKTYSVRDVWEITQLPDGVRQRAVAEFGRWVETMRLGHKSGLFRPQPFHYIDDGKGHAFIRDGRTGSILEKIDEGLVDAVLPREIKSLVVGGG